MGRQAGTPLALAGKFTKTVGERLSRRGWAKHVAARATGPRVVVWPRVRLNSPVARILTLAFGWPS